MSFDPHQPNDFLASPAELPVAGAPSPVAFRRLVKRRLFGEQVARQGAGLDDAWRVDREVDDLIAAKLMHLVWALGVQVEAARDAGLASEARGWFSGLATAGALRMVPFDPIPLGLSGGDGLAPAAGGVQIDLAVPPNQVGDTALWLLEWGRRRKRRFTVAIVAPGPKLVPFDWETVRRLAEPENGRVRSLTLAWVPDDRVTQIPWGETQDDFPVALLPTMHLKSSGVHLVRICPDELLGAVCRRRPKRAQALESLSRAVRSADEPAAWDLLAGGWMPPVLTAERPELSSLLAAEKPRSFAELVTVMALADDELRRGYFLERYQSRREGRGGLADELPQGLVPVVEDTRGLVMFTEQIAALIVAATGWDLANAYRRAGGLSEPWGADVALEPAAAQAAARGMSEEDVAKLVLALRRWGPLALSRRDAAARAALVYELAYLKSRR